MELRHARFTIITSSIPDKFRTRLSDDRFTGEKIDRYNFESELQLIGRYSDLKRQSSITSDELAKVNLASSQLAASDSLDPQQQGFGLEAAEVPIVRSEGLSEYERKVKIVEEMMAHTKQEREVCYFYLESTNWSLDDAVTMFKNMTE